jgi:RNA polymerase sigma factor (TIGR02999 family)
MSDLTQILEAVQRGEARATNELLPAVYAELRSLAAQKMARERPGHTLQPTALVHEAYLRLIGGSDSATWSGRTHFFAAAAEAMRRILIESARRKQRLKHGGHLERVDIEAVEVPLPMPEDDLLALDDALDRLATVDRRAAEMVKLCFFMGLTQAEAAKELGISLATAERVWAFGRTWLFREMRAQGKVGGP